MTSTRAQDLRQTLSEIDDQIAATDATRTPSAATCLGMLIVRRDLVLEWLRGIR
jgi:hypothetical protein